MMSVSMYGERTKDFLDKCFNLREDDTPRPNDILNIKVVKENTNFYRAILHVSVLTGWTAMYNLTADFDEIYLSGSQVKKIIVKKLNSKLDELKKASKQTYENRINSYKKDILNSKSTWENDCILYDINELKISYKLVTDIYERIDKTGVDMFTPVNDKYSRDNIFFVTDGLLTKNGKNNYEIEKRIKKRDDIIATSIRFVLEYNFKELIKEISKDYYSCLQSFEEEKLRIIREI